jgi:hypothetical protein
VGWGVGGVVVVAHMVLQSQHSHMEVVEVVEEPRIHIFSSQCLKDNRYSLTIS